MEKMRKGAADMKKRRAALAALLLALVLALPPSRGRAVLSDVYFTAANDQVMELSQDTMPFWSGGVLYVSSQLFDGTDLGVSFARNRNLGLAMLYTARMDLRFDIEGQMTYDKEGKTYTSYAIEQGGVLFFPLDLVCSYFGLRWTSLRTETAPLIRVTSASAILDDAAFLDAASWRMGRMYEAYEKAVTADPPADTPETPSVQPSRPNRPVTPTPPVSEGPPPIQAAEGQKVYLMIESTTPEATRAAMKALDGVQATFLLTAEQMEDGDLLRGLTAEGHMVALLASGAEEAALQLAQAREAAWRGACLWLDLVYCGESLGTLLEEEGCVQVLGTLDRRDRGLRSSAAAESLLRSISRYQEDVGVLLGRDSGCTGGLGALLDALEEAGYRTCGWRLTA